MPSQATVYRVMVAAPSDVTTGLAAIQEAVAEWNAHDGAHRNIQFLPVAWTTHSAPSMNDRPQAVINQQVAENSDLLVALFWTRLGSPTGVETSGTVEEIKFHIARKRPVLVYFRDANVNLRQTDLEQWIALEAFRSEIQRQGLTASYKDDAELTEIFRRHLTITVETDPYFAGSRPNSSANIATSQLSVAPLTGKFDSWRQAFDRTATSAPILFQQYLETITEDLRGMYLTQPDQERRESELEEKLNQSAPIRDQLLEAFTYFAGEEPQKGSEAIGAALERLLPIKFAPDRLPPQGWRVAQTESTSIFLYELYLRTVAQLLSANAFATLGHFLKRYYVVPLNERHRWGNNARFMIFRGESPTLSARNYRLHLKRYDMLADFIKTGCGGSESVFQSVRDADLLLALRSIVHNPSSSWWYPRTLIYAPLAVSPLFIRFEQRRHFKTLCDLLDVPDKPAMVEALNADERGRGMLFQDSWEPTSIRALMNLQKLDTLD
jgi:hypothetical protein